MRKDVKDHLEERKAIFNTISPKTSRNYWKSRFKTITDDIVDKIKLQKSGDLLNLYDKEVSAEYLKLVTGLTNMTAA